MAGELEIAGPDLIKDGIPLEDLDSELPTVAQVDGHPVVIVRTSDGPRVVGGQCTHYGGPLGDGLCLEGQIRCPWHHAAFDLITGEAVGAPAFDPIAVYDTVVRDDRAFVTGVLRDPAARPTPVSTPETVVIVGSGAAGAAAAEALRKHGYTGPVTMVGEEPPIDRPNVSKDYLAGTAPEEWMPLRSPEYYADVGIDLIAGVRVTSIDATSRTVSLENDVELSYDALLLAPGAEPRRLPVAGADLPHVHYLRTLADSEAIIGALGKTTRSVIVGAGFIGLEVAASLRHRDIDVTVVAPEEIPLATLIGERLGRFVIGLHREHGVAFRLGTGVKRITERQVELADDTSIPADLVVIGIGVVPRTHLAEAAGLDVANGIVVDSNLRTSNSHIWAAGDAASYPGPDGKPVRVEHWVLAQRQGQTAARNILGEDAAFTEPPFFWSQHYDVPVNVTGHVADWDDAVVVGDPDQRDVLVANRKAGVIRAVASIYRDRESLRAEAALETGNHVALERLLVDEAT